MTVRATSSTLYAGLSDEAREIADALRGLQDGMAEIEDAALPDLVVTCAQALDRACQTLDDFSAIFARLRDSIDAVEPGAVNAAIAAASQDNLRRRLSAHPDADRAETGRVDLF